MDPIEENSPTYDLSTVLSAVQTSDFAGLSFKFRLEPGSASIEDVTRVLRALSQLHQACGGGPLLYYQESSGLLRTIPARGCYYASIDQESVAEFLREGGYLNPTQAIHHSFAVLLALFSSKDGSLYLRKGDELELFDPLALDSRLRGEITSTPDEDSSVSHGEREVFFADSKSFQSLMQIGEFSSFGQCLNVALNTMAFLIERRKNGWDIVRKSAEEVSPILLPSP